MRELGVLRERLLLDAIGDDRRALLDAPRVVRERRRGVERGLIEALPSCT